MFAQLRNMDEQASTCSFMSSKMTSCALVQICVVGGGAGGVEVSMALNHRLKVERQTAGKTDEAKCSISLFSSGQILQGHTPSARRKFLRLAKVTFCCCCLLTYFQATDLIR